MLQLVQAPEFLFAVLAAILLLMVGVLPAIFMTKFLRQVWLTTFGLGPFVFGLFLWNYNFDQQPSGDITQAVAQLIAVPLICAGSLLSIAAMLSWRGADRSKS